MKDFEKSSNCQSADETEVDALTCPAKEVETGRRRSQLRLFGVDERNDGVDPPPSTADP